MSAVNSKLALGISCLVFLSGCSAWLPKENTEAKPQAKSLTLIGRVASLPPDRKFVLIQSYGRSNLEPGAILTTRGTDERTANLKVTGEKMGQFAAADIQSGNVELGDAVYSLHVPKPEPASPAPAANPAGTETSGATPPPQAAGPGAPVPELPEAMPEPPPENVQKNN